MASSSHCFLILCLALLIAMAVAAQFKVGGSMGWTVPKDPNAMPYNQWASRNRFNIGDSLLFVYHPEEDSVLQVTQEAYNNCDTSSYVKRFEDGNTVLTFDHTGPYYFISGVGDNCNKNEKLIVVVMADRTNRSGSSNVPPTPMAPSPSPTSEVQPSSPPSSPPPSEEVPPPAAEAQPSPAPTEESAPPPPPPPAIEFQPSPAPTEESTPPPPPPPNGAYLNVLGMMSSIGAFFGSLLVFVL